MCMHIMHSIGRYLQANCGQTDSVVVGMNKAQISLNIYIQFECGILHLISYII